MESQTIINTVLILSMIVGFTTIAVINPDTGIQMEPTHYCESLGIKMYCARTTSMYCYPSLETRTGSKKCSEGWKEIPEQIENVQIDRSSNKISCNSEGCK